MNKEKINKEKNFIKKKKKLIKNTLRILFFLHKCEKVN